MSRALNVVQSDKLEEQVPHNILAQAIVDISNAAKALTKGLTRDAVVVLVAHRAALPKSTVRVVLENLESLKSWTIPK
ncbi:MAG: hypothetical protein JWQ87_2024 [Candidatus Sulfotelmatobacter sp.]|nr:hypothetical protein [Candidatus Sulfotelmatobacter sp.]